MISMILSSSVSYKGIAIEVVYLQIWWLHCSTRELQYFKLVFLKIQNVPLRTIFTNPVTYYKTYVMSYYI